MKIIQEKIDINFLIIHRAALWLHSILRSLPTRTFKYNLTRQENRESDINF